MGFNNRSQNLVFNNQHRMNFQKVPQTKKSLPSRGISSSYQTWIDQKRQQDSTLWTFDKNYWVIRGKVYDLTQFIPKHPGGSHWLEYTKGHNITQHYVVHHLNIQKTDKILQKYEVKNLKIAKGSLLEDRYTFQKDGLYQEVKKRLLQKHSVNQLQDSSKTILIGITLFIAWLVSLICTGYYQSYWMALVCGYLILPVTGIAHNFVHKKNSLFKYFYLVTGFTPKQWQIMHCLSHHQYTNTLLDYELQAFQPLAYFIRVMPENSLIKILIVEIAYIIMIPLNILLKLFILPLIQRTRPQWQYLVPLMQVFVLYALNQNWTESIKLFLLIHCFFGFIFTKVTFGGHRVQTLWTEGCQQVKDFGEHSLYTCNDIYPSLKGGFLSFMVMSGFNIHTVHHLFPTVDNQHLYKVHQILLEVCKQRDLENSQYPLLKAIISVYKNYFFRKQWKFNKDKLQ